MGENLGSHPEWSMESSSSQVSATEPEVLSILRDAISMVHRDTFQPAAILPREMILAEACFSDQVAVAFSAGMELALESMLQKRKRSMQTGLKQLADVTEDTFNIMTRTNQACVLNHDVAVLREGAEKLRALTLKTVVDYGTHIKYEAMKSLIVGDVDIHRELNDFIGAWKLRNPREAGLPFGLLMRKLSFMRGHDEL